MAVTAPQSEVHNDVVIPLFLAHFNRAAESEAFTYYNERYDALLQSEPDVARANQALAREIYLAGQAAGELPADADFANAAYVESLYANVLGRDGQDDPDGLAYWTQSLDDGVTREEVAMAFITAARESERDGVFMENRTEVAQAFALPENSGAEVIDDLTVNASQILENVTEDPATVEAAMALLVASGGDDGGDAVAGTLTLEADELVGTDGDDVFSAPLIDGAQTLGSDDRVDGGSGSNTLKAGLVAGVDAALAEPELIRVQQLDLHVEGAGEAGLNLARAQDVEAISVEANEGASVRFADAGDVGSYTLQGEGDTLALQGVTAETVTLTGVETLTLSTDAEAAQPVSLVDASTDDEGLDTLNLTGTGAASYTWTETTAQLDVIDARGQEGGVTVDASAFTEAEGTRDALLIDGSDADDRFILSHDTSVLGHGGNDTFVLAGHDDIAFVAIEDFGQGDRIEFAAAPEGSAVNWVGDLAALDIDFDIDTRDLDSVRDDVVAAVGDNGAGYVELDGELYVLSTAGNGTVVNLGEPIDLMGATIEDNALTLA